MPHPIVVLKPGQKYRKPTIAQNLQKRRAATKRKQIAVGFFADHVYPDGTPMAYVASINEFGNSPSGIPMRPFNRQAASESEEGVKKILKQTSDKDTGGMTRTGAEFAGTYAQGILRQTITRFASPPNYPSTIRRKGFNNPLIETRLMSRTAEARIEKKDE